MRRYYYVCTIELGVVGHTDAQKSAILTRLFVAESILIHRRLLPPTPTNVSHGGERVIFDTLGWRGVS